MYVKYGFFAYFRMKFIHIFLFLNFAATLALGEDCYLEDQTIRRLEKKLSKIANKYNGEYELELENSTLVVGSRELYLLNTSYIHHTSFLPSKWICI